MNVIAIRKADLVPLSSGVIIKNNLFGCESIEIKVQLENQKEEVKSYPLDECFFVDKEEYQQIKHDIYSKSKRLERNVRLFELFYSSKGDANQVLGALELMDEMNSLLEGIIHNNISKSDLNKIEATLRYSDIPKLSTSESELRFKSVFDHIGKKQLYPFLGIFCGDEIKNNNKQYILELYHKCQQ